MTPAAIIREARADGVNLALSLAGTIKATGDGAAVNRWLAMIRDHKTEIMEVLKAGVGGATTTSRWWLVHHPERNPVAVAYCPEATPAEILVWHPDAVAAEPFARTIRPPAAPLAASAEAAIRAWLALIGETDPAIIAEVIERCRADQDARDYFTRRAVSELPHRPSAGSWPPQRGG